MYPFLLLFNLIRQLLTIYKANENEEVCIRQFLLSNVLPLKTGKQERKNTDISNRKQDWYAGGGSIRKELLINLWFPLFLNKPQCQIKYKIIKINDIAKFKSKIKMSMNQKWSMNARWRARLFGSITGRK